MSLKNESEFTKEELWILRAAIEHLHDEHIRYPQRFSKETRMKSFDLMQKVLKIIDDEKD